VRREQQDADQSRQDEQEAKCAVTCQQKKKGCEDAKKKCSEQKNQTTQQQEAKYQEGRHERDKKGEG
jgi:hypothetical protein